MLLIGFWRPRDGVTHWRFYVAPAVAVVLAVIAVFATDAGPTPDFWVGLSAGLAGVAAAGFVLIIQGFMPLEWWTREAPAPDQAA